MNREFQVVYQKRSPTVICEGADIRLGVGTGDLKTLNLIAHDEEEVRLTLETKFEVVKVTELRAVVDWDKPVWDLDEAAAALGMKGKSLSDRKGDGTIPWSDKFRGVPRRVFLKAIEDSLNAIGKKVVRELEEAA